MLRKLLAPILSSTTRSKPAEATVTQAQQSIYGPPPHAVITPPVDKELAGRGVVEDKPAPLLPRHLRSLYGDRSH
jgi:hypothetical protein